MKNFTVTIERRTIQIQQCEVQIEADNEAEARVLAKYQRIDSWEWHPQPDEEAPRRVVKIEDQSSAAYQVDVGKALSDAMANPHEAVL